MAKKVLVEQKTINQFVTANLVSNLSMVNVLTLMNVPNQTLVIPLPFAEIHQDLLLVLVRREVLEMLKILVVNQEVNVKLIEIVLLLQHVVKVDALILALVNVDPELFVKWLLIKPYVHVLPEPVVIQDLNAGKIIIDISKGFCQYQLELFLVIMKF